ncbi:MAG: GlsB/YeaQ/YmgE family stress response membrane protein [Erysipelotrichaceae bacterium]|nr:GlsB/YeaQ/YmgE family stress response membrane protein [Erysipelotrichaceae bacterium]
MGLLISLLISAAFGYVAANLMKLAGPWYLYVILGLAGGFVGSILFDLIGFSSNSIISEAIVSIVGACVVIALFRRLRK